MVAGKFRYRLQTIDATNQGLGPRHQGRRCSMGISTEGLGRSKEADPAAPEIHAREGQKGCQQRFPCGVTANRDRGTLPKLRLDCGY